jgi:hypothetical protein
MTPLSLGAVLALTYEWIKAGHVIFVIFWIAGLFMLPRYYIYHQESPPGSAEEKRWIDRERKLPIYARERVSHVWLVDPLERMIEVYRLDGEGYRLVVTRGGTDRVRLEPFAAIEIELDALWPTPPDEPK